MQFTKRQASELITAIKGRGEIPLKLAYLGEGAYNWVKVATQRSGGVKGGIESLEAELLRRRARNFIETYPRVKSINLIDLGPGDATPVLPIIDELENQGMPFRYVPVDISRAMLGIATSTVKKRVKNLKFKQVELDFENGSFSDIIYGLKREGSANLMVFLGSTLGNFSDMHRVLSNFRDSMTADDYLMTGVQLVNYSKVDLLLSHYDIKDVGDFVLYIPELIGIRRNNVEWVSLWNEKKRQVEIRLKIKGDVKVTVGKDNFALEKGENILAARSHKFTESTFTELFQDSGFRTELFVTNSDETYALSMVQPVRYAT